MEGKNKGSIYIVFLVALVLVSSAASYYRYVIAEDFIYFTTEEEIPSQFDIATYLP